MLRYLISITFAALLSACARSHDSTSPGNIGTPRPAPPADPPLAPPPDPPPDPPPPPLPPPPALTGLTKAEAFRFLNQATFGATERDAEELMEVGLEAWIDAQVTTPASLQLPYLLSVPEREPIGTAHEDRVDIWFRNAVHGTDQLRQRVAFALSEIMVVSELSTLVLAPYSLASYYDLLAQRAFVNFRELMEKVTLHPAMGVYLSMLGNRKPHPETNIRPDENYARELMQLFTIGLVELNRDGTPKLDGDGQPIPTYNQEIIEAFAHVFTGWNYAAESFTQAWRTVENQVQPMQLYPEFHDTAPKTLLRGVTLPAGQSGEQDLADALDNIFYHPNVGPFVSTRLIQRLVTSNPSPEYVARVAGRFNDNGSGVRGDLGAVVKAILLDDEARKPGHSRHQGKLKEPILRVTQVWRAYGAKLVEGRYSARNFRKRVGQGPLQASSVFNFFDPFYAPTGGIADAGLVAPELEIASEYNNALLTNLMFAQARSNSWWPNFENAEAIIDIDEEITYAEDIDALVDRVAAKLLGGDISLALRAEAVGLAGNLPASDRVARVAEVIYLIAASPEFAIQH